MIATSTFGVPSCVPSVKRTNTVPRASRNKHLLREFEPLMRKGVSEIDLHNALSALSREVGARRMVAREPPSSPISAWSFFSPIR
jgi:hypothetical protein